MAKAEKTLHFDLVLLGFPNADFDKAVTALARAFALTRERAQAYVYQAPVKVVADATEDILKSYVNALHNLGADLQVTCQETDEVWLLRAKSDAPQSKREDTPIWMTLIEEELSELRELGEDEGDETICPHCGKPQFSSILCRNCGRAISVPTEGVKGSLPSYTGEVTAVPDDKKPVEPPATDLATPEAEGDFEAGEPSPESKGADEFSPEELGVKMYAPPDLDGERDAKVDRIPTGDFFVSGRKGRPLMSTTELAGLDGKKAKKKKAVKFDRHGKVKAAKEAKREKKTRVEKDSPRRQRIALAILVISFVAAVAWGFTLWIKLPHKLHHTNGTWDFSVTIPGGYDHIEPRSGELATRLGSVPYSAYLVRKRDDPVGSLTFSMLSIPSEAYGQYHERRLMIDVLRLVVAQHRLRVSRISGFFDLDGAKAIEADFTTTRQTRIYEGVVRILSAHNTLLVMMCEGTGQACKQADNAVGFFDSFEIGDS